jgi:hypothetical protein
VFEFNSSPEKLIPSAEEVETQDLEALWISELPCKLPLAVLVAATNHWLQKLYKLVKSGAKIITRLLAPRAEKASTARKLVKVTTCVTFSTLVRTSVARVLSSAITKAEDDVNEKVDPFNNSESNK